MTFFERVKKAESGEVSRSECGEESRETNASPAFVGGDVVRVMFPSSLPGAQKGRGLGRALGGDELGFGALLGEGP